MMVKNYLQVRVIVLCEEWLFRNCVDNLTFDLLIFGICQLMLMAYLTLSPCEFPRMNFLN